MPALLGPLAAHARDFAAFLPGVLLAQCSAMQADACMGFKQSLRKQFQFVLHLVKTANKSLTQMSAGALSCAGFSACTSSDTDCPYCCKVASVVCFTMVRFLDLQKESAFCASQRGVSFAQGCMCAKLRTKVLAHSVSYY